MRFRLKQVVQVCVVQINRRSLNLDPRDSGLNSILQICLSFSGEQKRVGVIHARCLPRASLRLPELTKKYNACSAGYALYIAKTVRSSLEPITVITDMSRKTIINPFISSALKVSIVFRQSQASQAHV